MTYGKIRYHVKDSPRLKENLKEGHKVCCGCKQELPLDKFKPGKGRFNVGPKCKFVLIKNGMNIRKEQDRIKLTINLKEKQILSGN
jgi:hypothetical protein